MLKIMRCKYCGTLIQWQVHDCVWVHLRETNHSDNGYYCDDDCIDFATPSQEDLDRVKSYENLELIKERRKVIDEYKRRKL